MCDGAGCGGQARRRGMRPVLMHHHLREGARQRACGGARQEQVTGAAPTPAGNLLPYARTLRPRSMMAMAAIAAKHGSPHDGIVRFSDTIKRLTTTVCTVTDYTFVT